MNNTFYLFVFKCGTRWVSKLGFRGQGRGFIVCYTMHTTQSRSLSLLGCDIIAVEQKY